MFLIRLPVLPCAKAWGIFFIYLLAYVLAQC